MLKFFSWFYIIYGAFEIFMILSGSITEYENDMRSKYCADTLRECGVDFMPMWKHWFIAATGIIGGILMVYFSKKLEAETKNNHGLVNVLKEGNLFSIFFIGLGIQMLVVEWGGLDFNSTTKTFCSIIILVGIGWNYLCRNLLAKQQS